VQRRIDADLTVATLEAIVSKRGVPLHSSAATTVPSWPPTRCATGVASRVRQRATSNRVRRGRTRSWCPSDHTCVMSCCRSSSLTPFEAQVMARDWKHEYNNYRPHRDACPVPVADFSLRIKLSVRIEALHKPDKTEPGLSFPEAIAFVGPASSPRCSTAIEERRGLRRLLPRQNEREHQRPNLSWLLSRSTECLATSDSVRLRS
jgi:hypothetical protein